MCVRGKEGVGAQLCIERQGECCSKNKKWKIGNKRKKKMWGRKGVHGHPCGCGGDGCIDGDKLKGF